MLYKIVENGSLSLKIVQKAPCFCGIWVFVGSGRGGWQGALSPILFLYIFTVLLRMHAYMLICMLYGTYYQFKICCTGDRERRKKKKNLSSQNKQEPTLEHNNFWVSMFSVCQGTCLLCESDWIFTTEPFMCSCAFFMNLEKKNVGGLFYGISGSQWICSICFMHYEPTTMQSLINLQIIFETEVDLRVDFESYYFSMTVYLSTKMKSS